MTKIIVAKMQDDWIKPYSESEYNKIPVVLYSTHPRFTTGTRFDYGFLRVSIEGGYQIIILPYHNPTVCEGCEHLPHPNALDCTGGFLPTFGWVSPLRAENEGTCPNQTSAPTMRKGDEASG